FPKPSAVSFDAFGTLYTPKESIYLQYHKIAKNYNIDVPVKTINENFGKFFKELQEKYPNYGKNQDLNAEKWWGKLITQIFEKETRDGKVPNELIKALLNYFTSKEAYKTFNDIIPFLTKLQENNIPLIIASNSDDRLKLIIESLKLNKFFPNENIYLSYDIDVAKPNPVFFDKILNNLSSKTGKSIEELKKNYWHVGDNFKLDYEAANKYGLNSILIDRNFETGFL
ncbi:hypothetical protein PACTADRAFT_29087, partial [Pachysolen tannophilus NRRL Y-2460]